MGRKTIKAKDYLNLWRDDPESWSIVPSTYAAAMLEKSLPTVEDLVAKDKLTAIIFDGDDDRFWKGVTMSSLLRHMEGKNKGVPMLDEAKQILEELAGQRRKNIIYYSDFMNKFGMNHNNPHHRKEISKLLCEVSTDSYQRHKFLLSVLVVNKSSGAPSKAFFKLARDLGAMTITESEEECFTIQCELVYNHYRK